MGIGDTLQIKYQDENYKLSQSNSAVSKMLSSYWTFHLVTIVSFTIEKYLPVLNLINILCGFYFVLLWEILFQWILRWLTAFISEHIIGILKKLIIFNRSILVLGNFFLNLLYNKEELRSYYFFDRHSKSVPHLELRFILKFNFTFI